MYIYESKFDTNFSYAGEDHTCTISNSQAVSKLWKGNSHRCSFCWKAIIYVIGNSFLLSELILRLRGSEKRALFESHVDVIILSSNNNFHTYNYYYVRVIISQLKHTSRCQSYKPLKLQIVY